MKNVEFIMKMQGDIGDEMYVVESGRLEAMVVTEQGKDVRIPTSVDFLLQKVPTSVDFLLQKVHFCTQT